MASIWLLGNPSYDIHYSIVTGEVKEITKCKTTSKGTQTFKLPLSEAQNLLQRLLTARFKRGSTIGYHACSARLIEKGYITPLDFTFS